MGYKIRYYQTKQTLDGWYFRLQLMTAVVLLVVILTVHAFSMEGRTAVQKYLLPESDKTVSALHILVTQLECRASFIDAIAAFCNALTDGA